MITRVKMKSNAAFSSQLPSKLNCPGQIHNRPAEDFSSILKMYINKNTNNRTL